MADHQADLSLARRFFRKLFILPLLMAIRCYQWVISPMIPPRCRYTPTCSNYAITALQRYGVLKGTWMAIRRISRCHPWGGSGYDPVP